VQAKPANGGRVSGAGTYPADGTRTVTATVKKGYVFLNWTENARAMTDSW